MCNHSGISLIDLLPLALSPTLLQFLLDFPADDPRFKINLLELLIKSILYVKRFPAETNGLQELLPTLIDRLGDDFLSSVSDGSRLQLGSDGVVTILPVLMIL